MGQSVDDGAPTDTIHATLFDMKRLHAIARRTTRADAMLRPQAAR